MIGKFRFIASNQAILESSYLGLLNISDARLQYSSDLAVLEFSHVAIFHHIHLAVFHWNDAAIGDFVDLFANND